MNITIFDMDWVYKKSFMPNVDCMRLSSYHKQKGDGVNFVTELTHLTLTYDVLYMCRENNSTPMPSRKLIDDSRTQLLGKGFALYGARGINAIIAACRPDYLLYELPERNAYANANFITFYANGQLITQRQDFHNTLKHHKKTVVTDKDFWKASDSNIIYCLQVLKEEKNIAFLEPISLAKILGNIEIRKNFLSLHFSAGTKFKWKNDYSSSYPEINNIISFLEELRTNTRSNLGAIPIKAVTHNHETIMDFDLDMLRVMQIVGAFKRAKLKCVVIQPKGHWVSQWGDIIADLEIWTRYLLSISYVEFVLHDLCKREAALWYTILNNPIKWKNNKIDNLLRWLTDSGWEDNKALLFIQWGADDLYDNKIDYNTIKQNINLLYKDITDE